MLKKRLKEMKNVHSIYFDKQVEIISITESEIINGSFGQLGECAINSYPICRTNCCRPYQQN